MDGARQSVRASFDEAVEALAIDKTKAAAVISAAQKLADIMDSDGWPMYEGRYDNVSPGVFLKYCDALGMTGDAIKGAQESKSSLQTMRLVVNRKAANG